MGGQSRKGTPTAVTAFVLLALVASAAVLAPPLLHVRADSTDVSVAGQGVSTAHWLGTDQLGRDVLARVLVATRTSLTLAALTTCIGAGGGALLGALTSVLGRHGARALSAGINLVLAFPGLLVAIFLSLVFGVGQRGAVLAIGVALIPPFARLTEALAADIAGRDYVAAARLLGASRRQLLVRHVLPNIAEPLIVNTTIAAGGALLAFSGLSFLGLGVQPPSYDWGRLLNEGLGTIYVNPAAALAPGVAVVVAGLAFNLAGDAAARTFTATPSPPKRPSRAAMRRRRPTEVRAREDEGAVLLQLKELAIAFASAGGDVLPVVDVSFDVHAGEIVGVVGESGSGKSLTALAAAGLLPPTASPTAAALAFEGMSMLDPLDRSQRRRVATRLSLVFQEAASALNPALRVGRQLAEIAEVHEGASRHDALQRARMALAVVHVPRPALRAGQYPHELSGGMRQRALLAMSLMGTPRLVIADEPTTALDVTVQAEVLRLLARLRAEFGTAVLLISHDIAALSQVCDRVVVMYGGTVVEVLPVSRLRDARHPYTRALVSAVPDLEQDRSLPLVAIPGAPPAPLPALDHCPFVDRCDSSIDTCRASRPTLVHHEALHSVACWNPHEARLEDVGS